MRHLFIYLICFTTFLSSFGQGAIFDTDSYLEREALQATRGYLPSKVNYAAYAPPAALQLNASCVAHAFGNAMVTGLMYHASNTTDEWAWDLKPSPLQIYYNNSPYSDLECSEGLNMEKVARYLLNYGATPQYKVEKEHNYYPYGYRIWGQSYPYSMEEDMQDAYAPREIFRLASIDDIKTALYQEMIVVAGVSVTESFKNVYGYSWKPGYSKGPIIGGHAVTIIGYNDNIYGGSLLVLNSWGSDWGVNGKTWVRYSDYQRYFIQAYGVNMSSPIYGSTSPTSAAEKPNTNFQLDESNPEDAALYGTELEENKIQVDPELEHRDIEATDKFWELIRGSSTIEEAPSDIEE